MRSTSKIIVLFVVGILCSCNLFETEPDFTPQIHIEGNKISCDYCSYFGEIITIDHNDILISKYDEVLIFEYLNATLRLKQTISYAYLSPTSGVQQIAIHNDEMAIGLADYNGTGFVFIYHKNQGEWSLIQELRIDRHKDNFGSDIEFDDNWMIIGANAVWRGGGEGRAYIYQKEGGQWVLKNELTAISSHGGDRFGQTVILQDKHILIGSSLEPTHNYELQNGLWNLRSLDTIGVTRIAHSGDLFMARTVVYDPKILSWVLNSDGSKTFIDHESGFENLEPSESGEIIEILGNLALVDSEVTDICYLLEFKNNKWITQAILMPDEDESNQYHGLAIGNGFIALGGYNDKPTDGTSIFVVYVLPI